MQKTIFETLCELHNQNTLLQQANVDVEAAQVAHATQEQMSHEWDTPLPWPCLCLPMTWQKWLHYLTLVLVCPPFESSLHQCHYSGWIEAYPFKNKSNEGIWERMANDYVPRQGACQILISDQGSEFCGAAWEQWLEKTYIEHHCTSGYNPQSNGWIERANGTI